MLTYLSVGLGAGNYKGLWDSSQPARDCILDYCTGIDCSGFVMRCWSWSESVRLTTALFCEPQTFASVVAGALYVKPGDVFNSCTRLGGVGHVKLFASEVLDGTFVSWEASGGADGRCVAHANQSYETLYNSQHYFPYVYGKVKDDPAADVFAFCAGQRDDHVVVAWHTLFEQDTRGFVVERGASLVGPFVAVSDELPRRGGDATGASYEFIDTGYSGGAIYYQLREIETSGRELLHGVTGPVSLASRSEER